MTKILSELIFADPKNNTGEHLIPLFAKSAILSVTEPPATYTQPPPPTICTEFFSEIFGVRKWVKIGAGAGCKKSRTLFPGNYKPVDCRVFFRVFVYTHIFQKLHPLVPKVMLRKKHDFAQITYLCIRYVLLAWAPKTSNLFSVKKRYLIAW